VTQSGHELLGVAERKIWNSSREQIGLLRLDAGRPDHLSPLLGIFDDEFAELGGRGWERLPAQLDELILGLWAKLLRRREFIKIIAASAVTWPLSASRMPGSECVIRGRKPLDSVPALLLRRFPNSVPRSVRAR
jgi:hypothetical protein